MSKLSPISARELLDILQRIGFKIDRQKGSHITLIRDKPLARVTVPNHKEIKIGMLRRIIRDADLTVEEFNELLKN
jgi:predicted RNA binding protein YcfA (HicA-like mRNA interferase family)